MKKLSIFALAALLVVAFAVPASALENTFGGYWRTRFFSQSDFNGTNSQAADLSRVDTRTRLYYTATINENLKFVNKFEFNAVWGGQDGATNTSYGDIGADGIAVQVKNSYADFNLGSANFKVGVQGLVIARGLFFDDDFAGAVATFNAGNVAIPLIWMKVNEGGTGANANDADVDIYGIAPVFKLGEGISINPYLLWAFTSDIRTAAGAAGGLNIAGTTAGDDASVYFFGTDVDATFGPLGVWFTGIMESGSVERTGAADMDIDAYLVALGAAYDMGMFDIHGQFFLATGDDATSVNDLDGFLVPAGQSYYWSEIMGLGIFDNQASTGAPANKISDIIAYNIGTKIKPMDKLTVALDLWYATKHEDPGANIDDTLGTEADIKVTYELVEGLNMDVVYAHLWVGEATNNNAANEEDADEMGVRLSLSF